jgi:hypothetical protein
VLNSSDIFIPNPADDPSWSIPYHNADIEAIIDGMVYYFSAAERNQVIRDKLGSSPRNVPLYELDLDFAKGCILSKRLLEVSCKTFFQSILLVLNSSVVPC